MFIRLKQNLFLNLPLHYRLLITFLPLIFLSVAVMGITAYSLAERQLFKNAKELLGATLEQTSFALNEKCILFRDELASIEASGAFQRIVADTYGSEFPDEYYNDMIKINQQFSDIARQGIRGLDSLYLKLNNGREFSVIQGYPAARNGINLSEWQHIPSSGSGPWYWLNIHPDTIFSAAENRQVITLFRKIGDNSSKSSGILLMNISASSFRNVLDAVHLTPGGYLLLAGPDGIMYSAGYTAAYTIGKDGFSVIARYRGCSGSFRITDRLRKKMIVVFAPVAVTGWTIAAVAPESSLMANSVLLRRFLLLAVAVMVVITGILVVIFSETITRPIRHLSAQVQLVREGSFDILFDIPQTNEIGILARGLTEMEQTVRALLSRVREEQEKKRRAELAAMQAQIRPHFLYNTLSSIKYLCDLNRNDDASHMTEALTKFYMGSLSGGREIIPLEDEIEHVRNYIIIQKMRYRDLVGAEFTIAAEAEQCEIPKLTIQPLVENSIYHGIKTAKRRGHILITAQKQGQLLIIRISDDGAGMAKEKLEEVRAMAFNTPAPGTVQPIGLRNVQQRIQLHYGTGFGLAIDSTENTGTEITIRLPFREVTNDTAHC